jgi:hypothetical protein
MIEELIELKEFRERVWGRIHYMVWVHSYTDKYGDQEQKFSIPRAKISMTITALDKDKGLLVYEVKSESYDNFSQQRYQVPIQDAVKEYMERAKEMFPDATPGMWREHGDEVK